MCTNELGAAWRVQIMARPAGGIGGRVVAPVNARQVHRSSRAAGCGCLIFMTALGYETGNLTTKRYTRAQDLLSKSPLRMVPTHSLTARGQLTEQLTKGLESGRVSGWVPA